MRNKFAHGVTTNLTFMNKSIVELINKMKLGYDPLPEVSIPRLKFTLAVTRLVSTLQAIQVMLSKARLPSLVELFRLNEVSLDRDRLSEAEVRSLLQKGQ